MVRHLLQRDVNNMFDKQRDSINSLLDTIIRVNQHTEMEP